MNPRGLIRNIKDQAILITGEPGVGRTRNTEGVIPYSIAAASSKKSGGKVSPGTRLWPLIS
jgi:myosin heavy subunit